VYESDLLYSGGGGKQALDRCSPRSVRRAGGEKKQSFVARLQSPIRSEGGGRKKAKFCGAIAVPDPFGGRGPKKSKVLWRDTNPARFFPVKHTYLSLDTYATEKRSNVPRPSRHGLAPNLSTVRKQAALTARRLGTTQTSAMRGRFSRRPDFVKVRMITEAKR
jgi:hypothetical protein